MKRVGTSAAIAAFVMAVTSSVRAQEVKPPIEPLGALFTGRILGEVTTVAVPSQIFTAATAEVAEEKPKHRLILSPGLSDGEGALVSMLSAGYQYQRPSKRGVQAVFTYGNVGLKGGPSLDLLNVKGKIKLTPAGDYGVSAVVEQRQLKNSYDRTKLLAAADMILWKKDRDESGQRAKVIDLSGIINAGVGRKSPVAGDDSKDSIVGVGILANLYKLGGLSIGVDYIPRNDVDGASVATVTLQHPVGGGVLGFGADKNGAITVSFLAIFD